MLLSGGNLLLSGGNLLLSVGDLLLSGEDLRCWCEEGGYSQKTAVRHGSQMVSHQILIEIFHFTSKQQASVNDNNNDGKRQYVYEHAPKLT